MCIQNPRISCAILQRMRCFFFVAKLFCFTLEEEKNAFVFQSELKKSLQLRNRTLSKLLDNLTFFFNYTEFYYILKIQNEGSYDSLLLYWGGGGGTVGQHVCITSQG